MRLFNEKTENYIITQVSHRMGKTVDELQKMLDVLEQLILIENPVPMTPHNDLNFDKDFVRILNNYVDDVLLKNSPSNECINYIEGMTKKVIRIVDPDEWDERWQEYDDRKANGERPTFPWMLKDNIDKLGKNQEYSTAYNKAHGGRNDGGHGFNPEMDDVDLFVVYLDICDRYKDDIVKEYTEQEAKKAFDHTEYCSRILKDEKLKKFVKEYELILWRDTNSKKDFATDHLRDAIKDSVIKLIGGPGYGKSAAIEYLRYKDCERKKNGENGVKVPILVELRKLSENGDSLEDLIAKEIGASKDKLDLIFKSGLVSLYLDGYNEILDDNIKKDCANYVDRIIREYGNMPIIITDRQRQSNPGIAMNASVFNIKLISDEQTFNIMYKFLEGNCQSNDEFEKACELLFENVEEKTLSEEAKALKDFMVKKDKKDRKLWSPFIIRIIAEYAQKKGKIIDKDNFWPEYLNKVLLRESGEKQETRLNALESMLTDFAHKFRNEGIDSAPKSELEKILIDKFGPSMNVDLYIQWAIEMRLIMPVNKDGKGEYEFFVPEIQEYFYNELYNIEEFDDDDEDYMP